jgi:hypothetical protein
LGGEEAMGRGVVEFFSIIGLEGEKVEIELTMNKNIKCLNMHKGF